MAADFLQQHRLLVNMKHGRLIDMTTELQTKGTIPHVVSLSPSFSLQNTATEYDGLLAVFPAVIYQAACFPAASETHRHPSYPHHRTPSARRRLPRTQPRDYPRPIPCTTHTGFHCYSTRHHHLLQTRPGVYLSSDPCGAN